MLRRFVLLSLFGPAAEFQDSTAGLVCTVAVNRNPDKVGRQSSSGKDNRGGVHLPLYWQ